ncbi:MAG: hypothetical protein WBA06_09305 [Candidatus Aquilonibacter sp.]
MSFEIVPVMNGRAYALVAICMVSLGVVACDSGASRGLIPGPTPTPGSVMLSSSSLAFTTIGASDAQTVTVKQSNYSGAFTASGTTCAGIATISAATAASFSVTPVAAGSCTFTITGGGGQSAALTIGVTTTTVGGS